jgi:ubiquitin C
MQKHENIALRFLPQISFEKSAPLTVEPTPDVVTRVFMIFQGVPHRDLGKWLAASSTHKNWAEVVGVDLSRASDANLFRILEWGGMEVTP